MSAPDNVRSVVVVSHDATLTGAPMSALRIWRAAKDSHGIDVKFVVLGAGPLLPEFERAGRTLCFRGGRFRHRLLRFARVKRLLHQAFVRRALTTLRPFDAIVINTGTLGYLMPTARSARVPVLTHVHEMRQWLTTRVPAGDLQRTLNLSDAVIACSQATRADLIELGCDDSLITVVHEPLPARAKQTPDSRRMVREMLGVSEDTVVVAGAGTADRRKGADLFLELGVLLPELCARPLCMPWFGDLYGADGAWLEPDARGAASAARFVGPVQELPDLLRGVDVFCLTSREDPFPLVMIEAAAAGIPVAAFQGSGGADELLADGVGLLTPYLNVSAMAHAIAELIDDPSAARRMGELGQAATSGLAPELLAAAALDVVRRAVAGKARA